jgi:hypothetical protein
MTTFTAAQRKMFAKMKIAMPDGSYPVRNSSDLQNAIDSVGEGENAGDNGNAIRKHICDRAKALHLEDKIPSTWNWDGTLKQSKASEMSHSETDDSVDEFLAHFGVKGMHWGVRRGRDDSGSDNVHEDHAKAAQLKGVVKKHGTKALSNDDLQTLVTRLNLESQHGRLNPAEVGLGKKALNELLGIGGNVGKQQATTFGNKYAAKGIEMAIKKAAAGKS